MQRSLLRPVAKLTPRPRLLMERILQLTRLVGALLRSLTLVGGMPLLGKRFQRPRKAKAKPRKKAVVASLAKRRRKTTLSPLMST